MAQNIANAIAVLPGSCAQPAHAALNNASSASAPIHVWIPNHPQATIARRIAATFAPRTPKLARQRTGKEMPYLVPAWAFRIIGTSTMTLPSRIVSIACHHVIPCSISPEASVYVVITTLIPIHSAAMLYVDHVRRDGSVGARSGFQSGLDRTSADDVMAGTSAASAATVVTTRGRPSSAAATDRVQPYLQLCIR